MTNRPLEPLLTRIAERPQPHLWGEDELLTLAEAAALLWPSGPLTTRSLRTAVRNGQLATVTIAGKMLTSRRQLGKMAECQSRVKAPMPPSERHPAVPPTFEDLFAAKMKMVERRHDMN